MSTNSEVKAAENQGNTGEQSEIQAERIAVRPTENNRVTDETHSENAASSEMNSQNSQEESSQNDDAESERKADKQSAGDESLATHVDSLDTQKRPAVQPRSAENLPPLTLTPPSEPAEEIREINSFEDLKPYLTLERVDANPTLRQQERLKLVAGKYRFNQGFDIDLADSFFDPYRNHLKWGILSGHSGEGVWSIDGGGHTLNVLTSDTSKVPVLPSLFGTVIGNFNIRNLKVNYQGDVLGTGFAHELIGHRKENQATGWMETHNHVENIEVNVKGNIESQLTELSETPSVWMYSSFANQNYNGPLATGFVWVSDSCHLNNIKVNVTGNIGSSKPPIQNAQKNIVHSGAFGFAFGLDGSPARKDNVRFDWKKVPIEDQLDIVRKTNYVHNIDVKVGGSIQAHGLGYTYANGVAFDTEHAIVERLNVTVEKDVLSKMHGSNDYPYSTEPSMALGIADSFDYFVDSNITIKGRLALEAPENIGVKPQKPRPYKGNNRYNFYIIAGMGTLSNSGYAHLIVKNNTIKIGSMYAEANGIITSWIGYGNGWDGAGKPPKEPESLGTNWEQAFENNTFEIGDIHYKQLGNYSINFRGLAEKWRTGHSTRPDDVNFKEVSAKNNVVKVKSLKIENPFDTVQAHLLMDNASNAKNNRLEYDKIDIQAKELEYFSGFGNLWNRAPEKTWHPVLTEGNQLTVQQLNINVSRLGRIGLMFGWQEAGQDTKNNSAKYHQINCLVKGLPVQAGEKVGPTYFGGVAAIGYKANNQGNRLYLGDMTLIKQDDSSTYFGLGYAWAKDGQLSNTSILVDGDLTLVAHVPKQSRNYPRMAGVIGYGTGLKVDNTHFQLTGNFSTGVQTSDGQTLRSRTYYVGAFAGQLRDSQITKSSVLLFKTYLPFVNRASGSTIDSVAHYVGDSIPQYWSGLIIAAERNQAASTITNSTLLVREQDKASILYDKDSVSDESGNNYVVVINSVDKAGRIAYRVSNQVSTEAERGSRAGGLVAKASDEVVGELTIHSRSFQNKYWNTSGQPLRSPYEITPNGPEQVFNYMTDPSAGLKVEVDGTDKSIIAGNLDQGSLKDYFHRHAVLRAANGGPTYDIFGLPGIEFLRLTYDGNGHDGGAVPTDSANYRLNHKAKVAGYGTMTRTGYQFKGWNTQADGQGTDYVAGSEITMDKSYILYAKWEKLPDPPAPMPEYKPKPDPAPEAKKREVQENRLLPKTGAATSSLVGWWSIIAGLGTVFSGKNRRKK